MGKTRRNGYSEGEYQDRNDKRIKRGKSKKTSQNKTRHHHTNVIVIEENENVVR